MKRLSRGTPHILTTGEIEATLATVSADPLLEQAIADVFGLTVDAWRKLPKARRAKHIIDAQEHGRLAAVLAGSFRARRDLIGESVVVKDGADPSSVADRLALIETQMQMVLDRLTEIDPGPRSRRTKGA